MTIDFNTLFADAGAIVKVADDLAESYQAIDDGVRAYQDAMDDEDQDFQAAVNQGLESALSSLQGQLASSISTLAGRPLTNLIIEKVHADVPMLNKTLANALGILIAQMEDNAESLDATTVDTSVTYGEGGSSSGWEGDNTGNGIIVITATRGDGQVCAFSLTETIRCAITAITSTGEATWRMTGEPTVPVLSPLWPEGSAVSKNVTSYVGASSVNKVNNGTFATEDTNAEFLPAYWIATEADLGVTLRLTDVEVQTVTINGDPDDGHYMLQFTDSEGRVYSTLPLAYNATQSDVQTALQALPFLGSVTVSTTGTTPNFTHAVVFYGVPNPYELDYVNNLTSDSSGGSPTIVINTTTPGAAEVMRGDRALEFIGDGSENTTLQTSVSLAAVSTYCLCIWCLCDIAPAAGVLTIDLIDGIDGTTLEDEEGVANTFTIDLTALGTYPEPHTAVFRTPRIMPPLVYLRMKLTTALSSGTSLFVDELALVAMTELYAGGPRVAAFTGAKNFAVGDTATITVLNNREGELHEWFHRLLGLGGSRILFPVATPGTQPDTLIA